MEWSQWLRLGLGSRLWQLEEEEGGKEARTKSEEEKAQGKRRPVQWPQLGSAI